MKATATVSVSVDFCDCSGTMLPWTSNDSVLVTVIVQAPDVAGPHFAVQRGRAKPRPVGADRDIIGQPAERKLARIVGDGRKIDREHVAGQRGRN